MAGKGTVKRGEAPPTLIGLRRPAKGLRETFAGVTRANYPAQVLAGVTLVAIAIPEQLATSRLAGVPAFYALIAFIAATLVFVFVGSNPIMSVGADSTIAPLFAAALVRLAPLASPLYLELVAMTAVVTGLVLTAIGLLRLGWIADFISLPIVTGFLAGIGVIIIVHQLPSALGVASGGSTVIQRLDWVLHHLGQASGWSIALALGTLVVLTMGEKLNARLPWALGAMIVATLLTAAFSLASHGVLELGTVAVGGPTWRLRWLTSSQWGIVLTISATLVVVILSQTAATTRSSSDAMGVGADASRDFAGVGLANVVAGLVGAFPVDASPARTTVARLAGGRTKLVGLSAAVILLALAPLGRYFHLIPLAALAGILFFIAARLIKVDQLAQVWRSSRSEFALGIISMLGVIFVGVEQGIAIAVGLAILEQTWRSAHPTMVELGRHEGTTSWEPLGRAGVARVSHVVVVYFESDLFFANAGVFRRDVHDVMSRHPHVKHFVLDAVAIADIDFTGMTVLSQIVDDLVRDKVTVAVARASDVVRQALAKSPDPATRAVAIYDSVDDAVAAARPA